MSYLALYRKYRPVRFEDLIGQEHVVKTLVNQIESGRLGHAYLFTGTRGTGKTTAAKIFAKAINCEHPINGSPCGKCATCKALSDPSNIDVLEIDAASNNGVNEIRELRENVQFPPVAAKYKVYIIDEVHMLSGAAFNALLKTLEEPPSHAVFILATTEVHKIPATILSRCMRFDFRLVSTERIAELIAKIYDEQGKKYEKEAVTAIAKAGEGSVRDALSVADVAISSGGEVLTYQDVTEILGTSNSEVLARFADELLSGDAGGALETVDALASLGKSMGVLMKDVTSLLRDVLIVKTCDGADKILSLPQSKYDALKTLADKTNEHRLLRALEIFADAENARAFDVAIHIAAGIRGHAGGIECRGIAVKIRQHLIRIDRTHDMDDLVLIELRVVHFLIQLIFRQRHPGQRNAQHQQKGHQTFHLLSSLSKQFPLLIIPFLWQTGKGADAEFTSLAYILTLLCDFRIFSLSPALIHLAPDKPSQSSGCLPA